MLLFIKIAGTCLKITGEVISSQPLQKISSIAKGSLALTFPGYFVLALQLAPLDSSRWGILFA